MIIASGKVDHPLCAIMDGARHSWFAPSSKPVTAWKTWIAGKLAPAGRLTIDDGAERALMSGKSLLPAGVRAVDGDFVRGDTIAIISLDGREIARGLASYDGQEARLISGKKSADIEAILGYSGRAAMVHRDDMVMTAARKARAKSKESADA